jgi:hypothetical protein
MNGDRKADLLALIERLENDIDLARKQSLGFTAKLLNMALLDARMKAYSITSDELKMFSDLIADAAHHADGVGIRKN